MDYLFSWSRYSEIIQNVDNDTTGLAAKFAVRSVPTTVVVQPNKDFEKKVGALAYGDLEKLING